MEEFNGFEVAFQDVGDVVVHHVFQLGMDVAFKAQSVDGVPRPCLQVAEDFGGNGRNPHRSSIFLTTVGTQNPT